MSTNIQTKITDPGDAYVVLTVDVGEDHATLTTVVDDVGVDLDEEALKELEAAVRAAIYRTAAAKRDRLGTDA